MVLSSVSSSSSLNDTTKSTIIGSGSKRASSALVWSWGRRRTASRRCDKKEEDKKEGNNGVGNNNNRSSNNNNNRRRIRAMGRKHGGTLILGGMLVLLVIFYGNNSYCYVLYPGDSSSSSTSSATSPFFEPVDCNGLLTQAEREIRVYKHFQGRSDNNSVDDDGDQTISPRTRRRRRQQKQKLEEEYRAALVDYKALLDPNLGELVQREISSQLVPFRIALHQESIDESGYSIMRDGYYGEQGVSKLIMEIMVSNHYSPGSQASPSPSSVWPTDTTRGLFVDLGMNVGWYSLLVASLGYPVAAFDPNPIDHVRVCQSKQLNAWRHESIQQYRYAVGSHRYRTSNIIIDPKTKKRKRKRKSQIHETLLHYKLGSSSVAEVFDLTVESNVSSLRKGKDGEDDVWRSVDMLTLDQFAEDAGWFDQALEPQQQSEETEEDESSSESSSTTSSSSSSSTKQPFIKLLKMDVQTDEADVIQGARRFLSSFHDECLVQHVLAEINVYQPDIHGQVFEEMASMGYRILQVLNPQGYAEPWMGGPNLDFMFSEPTVVTKLVEGWKTHLTPRGSSVMVLWTCIRPTLVQSEPNYAETFSSNGLSPGAGER